MAIPKPLELRKGVVVKMPPGHNKNMAVVIGRIDLAKKHQDAVKREKKWVASLYNKPGIKKVRVKMAETSAINLGKAHEEHLEAAAGAMITAITHTLEHNNMRLSTENADVARLVREKIGIGMRSGKGPQDLFNGIMRQLWKESHIRFKV